MICWMFPGQPIAFSDVPSEDRQFQEIARLCCKTTGFDPLENSLPVPNLPESVKLQLFGVCCSLYRFSLLTSQGKSPDIIAEHSMGIYPALAASGSIDVTAALELTMRIGERMADMGKIRDYSLGCVTGLDSVSLQGIAASNRIYIANYNTSRHFLLAGERSAIEIGMKEAVAAGAFSVSTFPCDAPLHTPLIKEITGDLQRIVAGYSFREPEIPLVEHIGQTTLTAAQIPAFVVDELCGPVFWDKTYRALCSRGVTHFQELGTGSVLSKFNRWIDSEA